MGTFSSVGGSPCSNWVHRDGMFPLLLANTTQNKYTRQFQALVLPSASPSIASWREKSVALYKFSLGTFVCSFEGHKKYNFMNPCMWFGQIGPWRLGPHSRLFHMPSQAHGSTDLTHPGNRHMTSWWVQGRVTTSGTDKLEGTQRDDKWLVCKRGMTSWRVQRG